MKITDLPSRCFQGVLPSIITTCDAEGIPNVTFLSQVYFVDAEHVALSCQFFNKTKKNVLANPWACLQIVDPITLDAYRVELQYLRDEREGPLFESMSRRIDAIATLTGMQGIFKLLSADVYRVASVEPVVGFLNPPDPSIAPDDPPPYRSEVTGLQLVCQRAVRATTLDELLAAVLGALDEAFGFEHSMVLLVDDTGARLEAIASHGYGEAGVGAEVQVGDGFLGTVARERCVLRVAGVGAELRYGRAIRASVHRTGGGRLLRPEIPLPGLVDAQSQLALPLVAGDRLLGVIAVESRAAAAFEVWHEAYLEIIAGHVALAIDAMTKRARELDDAADGPAAPERASATPPPPSAGGRCFRLFASDDCVFVDDDYLVRNMPGRILWRLLRAYVDKGRTEFSNRELRLDPSLGLPAIRDNLESRLILLRKRLDAKDVGIKLVPTGRGLFRLDVAAPLVLEESP